MEPQELLGKYLSGNASKDEVNTVDEWLSASKKNQQEFFEMQEVWNLSNLDRFDDVSAWERVQSKMTTKSIVTEEKVHEKSTSLTFNYLKIAASLVILVVAVVFLSNYFSGEQGNTALDNQQSFAGEINQDVLLSDGSKLFLSKLGQLTYESDFVKDQERKVKLKGKAFFDITKNENKPFVIETNNARILVTGTSFLVNEKEGYTEVIVKSGSVKLMKSHLNTSITLKKGERGIVSSENRGLVKQKNRDINFLSWMTGSFNFVRTPLSEVFQLLEDKYDVDIILKNRNIGDCKLNSEFVDRPIDEIMSIISVALNVQISQENGKFIVDGNDYCK